MAACGEEATGGTLSASRGSGEAGVSGGRDPAQEPAPESTPEPVSGLAALEGAWVYEDNSNSLTVTLDREGNCNRERSYYTYTHEDSVYDPTLDIFVGILTQTEETLDLTLKLVTLEECWDENTDVPETEIYGVLDTTGNALLLRTRKYYITPVTRVDAAPGVPDPDLLGDWEFSGGPYITYTNDEVVFIADSEMKGRASYSVIPGNDGRRNMIIMWAENDGETMFYEIV